MNKHLLAALLAATLSLHAEAAPSYSLQLLPNLAGTSGVPLVEGINASGQVVGFSQVDGDVVATLWSGGSALGLGGLPGQAQHAMAFGINDAGVVVGDAAFGETGSHAFRWSAGGGMQDLGGARSSGINNAGQIVGSAYGANGRLEAGLWRADGAFTPLGHLGRAGSTATQSIGWGLSDSGFVVANTYYNNAPHTAWRWSAAQGKVTLFDLPGGAGNYIATEVNDAGWAVGESYTDSSGSAVRAVLWNAAGQAMALQGNGFQFSAAQDINNAGVVVGRGHQAGGGQAFVWTAETGMLDLDTLIVNAGSFRLGEASVINESGQIAGWGYDLSTGATQAFLLSPVPEPETYALFGAGLLALATLARRRRPDGF